MTSTQFYDLLFYSWQKPKRLVNFFKTGYVSSIEMVVSHEKKMIYVLNPKVATTSIVEYLSGVEDEFVSSKLTQKQIRSLKKISYIKDANQLREFQRNGYFIFSFVRNPYARLISMFKQKYTLQENGKYKKRAFALSRHLEYVDDFEDMVKRISSIPDEFSDTHFMSQSAILYGQAFDLKYDAIGHLESFDEDFEKVTQSVSGLSGKPQVKNKTSSSGSLDYKEWFSSELSELVYDRFEQDFNKFGYSKLSF